MCWPFFEFKKLGNPQIRMVGTGSNVDKSTDKGIIDDTMARNDISENHSIQYGMNIKISLKKFQQFDILKIIPKIKLFFSCSRYKTINDFNITVCKQFS